MNVNHPCRSPGKCAKRSNSTGLPETLPVKREPGSIFGYGGGDGGTRAHPEPLIPGSRMCRYLDRRRDAQIYANDAGALGQRLSYDALKSSAVDFRQQQPEQQEGQKSSIHDRSRERALRPEGLNQQPERERIYTPMEHERHHAPLSRELDLADASQFGWKVESGTVHTYQHIETHRHIHIDGATGQFYD